MTRRNRKAEEFKLRHMGLFQAPEQEIDNAGTRIRQRLHSGSLKQTDDVSVELPAPVRRWSSMRLSLAFGAVAVLALVVFLRMPRRIDAYAVVSEGSLLRVAENTLRQVQPGERIADGEIFRASGASNSITLADGSRVELRSQSEFSIERAEDGIRIHLFRGGLIINAAKQVAGHLYVQTKHMIVSVVGTVFLVNAEEEGSRVAVIEGEVRVQQGTTTQNLLPGEQLSTNPKMEPIQVPTELSWRQNATVVALLEQNAPPSEPAPPKRIRFEVDSLRALVGSQNTEAAPFENPLRCRGVDGVWSTLVRNGRSGMETPLGRCVGVFSLIGPTASVLANVYDIRFDRLDAAKFFDTMFAAQYRLDAKADDPSTVTREQLRQMLETMLIERFKLQVRRETRGTQKGYTLLQGKDGVKFKEAIGDEEFTQSFTSNRVCQSRGTGPCPIILKGKFSMKGLAATLGMFWTGNGDVLDNTNLRGIYDLQLTLNPLPTLPASPTNGPRGSDSGQKPPREYAPPLAQAIEEQLGLRLEYGQQIPIEWLVVDHFEKPLDN